MQQYIDELVRRGRLGAAWLKDQVSSDGMIPLIADNDLGCYYKCVLPLRLSGYSVEASRVLDTIMRLHYTANGDLRNSAERKTSGTYTSVFCQVYPNGWVTLGAHALGRFDVVRKLMAGIIDNYYDEEMGTFRACALPRLDHFDINSCSMAVELFMLTDLPRARRAADFIIRHIDGQPDLDKFYHGRVVKPFDYITELDAKNPDYGSMDFSKSNQAYWFLGLSAAALTQLYELTADERFLAASERLFAIFLACGDHGFQAPGSGKSLWTASMLYRLTGKSIYRDSAFRLIDYFFSIQREDGTFLLPNMKPEEATPKFLFDTTPEYTRWFFEVAAEFAMLDRSEHAATTSPKILI